MKTELFIKISELNEDELVSGIRVTGTACTCIVCGWEFERGIIYSVGDRLMEAERAALQHVETEHGGMLTVLLGLPGTVSGLSDLQCKIFERIGRGENDREIARGMGGKAESTIRNHRFQFRRRLQEALILKSIHRLLEKSATREQDFISFHESMPIHDDRVMTTHAEAEKILQKYLTDNNGLRMVRFPRKEKEKLVILRRLSEQFVKGRTYTEKDVNTILQPICEDFVTVRRYLIEYRFLSRKADGSEYWLND